MVPCAVIGSRHLGSLHLCDCQSRAQSRQTHDYTQMQYGGNPLLPQTDRAQGSMHHCAKVVGGHPVPFCADEHAGALPSLGSAPPARPLRGQSPVRQASSLPYHLCKFKYSLEYIGTGKFEGINT